VEPHLAEGFCEILEIRSDLEMENNVQKLVIQHLENQVENMGSTIQQLQKRVKELERTDRREVREVERVDRREVKEVERKDGERKDGERRDGERKDGERKDGERKDGERKGGERMGTGNTDQILPDNSIQVEIN
jgi:hypothetical protein